MLGRRKPGKIVLKAKIDILDCYLAGVEKRIEGTLAYEARDPFAVCLTFQEEGKMPVPWCFSRELLITGTTLPHGAGDGDVQIWPMLREGHNSYMAVMVSVNDVATVAVTKMKPVTNFIKKMERLLPIARCSDSLAIEDGIRWLQEKRF